MAETCLVVLGYIREAYGRSKAPFPITICTDSMMVSGSADGSYKKFKVAHIKELATTLRAELEALPLVQIQHLDNQVVKELLGH